MKLSIISQNGHRLNERTADILAELLKDEYDTTREFVDDCDVVLMTSGVGFTEEAARAYESDKKILFFYEEIASTFIHRGNTKVISQFEGLGDFYFPISKLYIFDELFQKDKQIKFYDFVYWGHKRDNREFYEYMPDNDKSLYIGEWKDIKPRSNHCNYIRDPEALHNLIGTGKRTVVDGSSYGFGANNLPLRIYEALGAYVIPDKMYHKWDSYDEAFNYYVGASLEKARRDLKIDLIWTIKEAI